MLLRIPVAHLHGGEITEGAYDDAIRHAITKLSHWHFTSTECYRQRVIQMGKDLSMYLM
ncbi:UDP-N-acetylglucosamine 2-epimerase [Plesiomonas shigelloides subsp. oncorhynchi]|nr:UDP-N-acetylglucosamine 2-epimerase [Plesiomonas shigelloides]